MEFVVNCSERIGPLDHFWESTGFTPGGWLLDADMQAALAYVGSVPHGGITWVRIHYLLDLVEGRGFDTESPSYDWSRLDEGLDVLVRNGLRPLFELMGNPSEWFSDFTRDPEVRAWKRLVRELALHLEERYGPEEVRSWQFESWNEPDVGFGWDRWPENQQGHFNYYDACSEGLKEADPELRLGGPGTCGGLSDLLRGFLAHCDCGTNYFTGEEGVRLDFVSVHEKGVRSCEEDLNPRSLHICEREEAVVRYIREHHPRLADRPFMNNECDPQTGWGRIHTWRARPYYAAIAAKIIHQHQRRLIDRLGVDYGLLSNDNGFLGTWGNRTLLARFGDADGFELTRKPVLNLMALLALLGDERLEFAGTDPAGEVGLIAGARDGQQVALLLYNSRDRIMSSGSRDVRLRLEDIPFEAGLLARYRIDAEHADPYTVWEEAGAPGNPPEELIEELRLHHEPTLIAEPREVEVPDGALELAVALPLPSVELVLLSRRPETPPPPVEGLDALPCPGLRGEQRFLLSWDSVPSRFVRTYEVLGSSSPKGPWKRLNAADTICTAWLDPRPTTGERYCRVQAVDYWGRKGGASEVLRAPSKPGGE